jgi:hypothetical protein
MDKSLEIARQSDQWAWDLERQALIRRLTKKEWRQIHTLYKIKDKFYQRYKKKNPKSKESASCLDKQLKILEIECGGVKL